MYVRYNGGILLKGQIVKGLVNQGYFVERWVSLKVYSSDKAHLKEIKAKNINKLFFSTKRKFNFKESL